MSPTRAIILSVLALAAFGVAGCAANDASPTRAAQPSPLPAAPPTNSATPAAPASINLPPPPPNALFLEPSNAANVTPPAQPMTLRTRLATLNFDPLNNTVAPPGNSAQAKTLQLNLFPDATFVVVPDRIDLHPKGFTLIGRVQSVEKSQVTLIVENQTLVGNIRAAGKLFQVRAVGNGLYAISEIDPKAFPPD